MTVCVGADQAAGDFGAIDGCGQHAERTQHCGDVKAAIMEKFKHIRIGEQAAEVRGFRLAARDLDQMGMAIARGELHQTQAVAVRMQAHRLAINRNFWPQIEAVGKVILVNFVCHVSFYTGRAEQGEVARA